MRIFPKIRGYTVFTTLPLAGVVDTSSKLFIGVSDTGNKLSLVSLLLLIKPCPGISSIP
jgi:hypothetical protein